MDIKELCKRVLKSNLSDEDKVEIIAKLNQTNSIVINQTPWKIEPSPLTPYYQYQPCCTCKS